MIEQPRAAIQFTQEVEVAPHDAGYRQFAPGDRFSAYLLGDRLAVLVNEERIVLDRSQAAELRDWLRGLPF